MNIHSPLLFCHYYNYRILIANIVLEVYIFHEGGRHAMMQLQEPTQTISPKATKLWRIEALIFFSIIFIIASVLLVMAYYFSWMMWIKIVLYILIAYIFIQAVVSIAIKPIYLQRTWRYEISDDFIQLKNGFLTVQYTVIPTIKIEYVTADQGPLLRKYNLASITIGTVASSHTIPALPEDEAHRLRYEIAQIAKIRHEASSDMSMDDANE